MYDRAPRDLIKFSGSTGQNVGPGSYDANTLHKSRFKADGYAPFLSMTSRETFLNISDQVVAAPGPGHYDPALAQEIVKGGKTLANKSKRFDEPVLENPGPGAYNVDKYTEFRQSKSAPANQEKNKAMGLVTSQLKFHRKPDAPSIPTPGKAYGYEECEDGTLKKQDPPDRDISIGPAFYNVTHDTKPSDSKASKTYKGVHFGKLTSKRSDFVGKVGPGPGEYEPYVEAQVRPENLNAIKEEQPRYEANIPRYHEAIEKESEKKGIPGPGKYDVKGLFEPVAPKMNTEGVEVEHPPFMSQSKRFTPMKVLQPAPGSYNDPRNAFESLKRVTGMKRSPFGQTSVRFTPGQKHRRIPGPGSYNITGMGSESMRKAYIESTRKGVFGTTTVRINNITKKEAPEIPGPNHYQVKEKPFQSRYAHLSSTFASVTSRLKEDSQAKEMPPPGSYDVQKSYQHSQVKHELAKPRTEAANRKHGSFMSAASRFAPPRDVVVSNADVDNPGPGSYNPQRRDRNGNMMTTKDNRFKAGLKNDVPGPGAYEFSPLVQDTVLKGTFNATLNNPITPQVETVHNAAASTAKHAFLLGV